ncbi:putative metal-dependent hydrolase YfiT [compost metagenome]
MHYNILFKEEFIPKSTLTEAERQEVILEIPNIIRNLRKIVSNLTDQELEYTYRSGGWRIRQIVHHLVDNDLNAYLRFKRALTEEEPISNSYREDLFAELYDYREIPLENSLSLLDLLHQRFEILLHQLSAEDYLRTMKTQILGIITLDVALQRFVWHNYHHIRQIELAIQRNK